MKKLIELYILPDDMRYNIYNATMALPESQLLFVGPLACARHGMMTSLFWQQRGRISFLCPDHNSIATGYYLQDIKLAASKIVEQRHPRCLVLLTCCQNAIIGTDFRGLILSMEKTLGIPCRSLEVNRLNMHGKRNAPLLSVKYDQLIYDFLQRREPDHEPSVNIIGTICQVSAEGELLKLLQRAGIKVRCIAECESYDMFLEMASSSLTIVLRQDSQDAAEDMKKKLGIPWLPLYKSYSVGGLKSQYDAIASFFNIEFDIKYLEEKLLKQLAEIKCLLNRCRVGIDGSRMRCPMALARMLVENNINIDYVIKTRFTGIETEQESWLLEHVPGIRIEVVKDIPLTKTTKMGRQFYGDFFNETILDGSQPLKATEKTGYQAIFSDLDFLNKLIKEKMKA